MAIKVSKAELVVLPLAMVLNKSETNTRLAYKIDITDSQPKRRDQEGDRFAVTKFIDAVSGAKIFELSGHLS